MGGARVDPSTSKAGTFFLMHFQPKILSDTSCVLMSQTQNRVVYEAKQLCTVYVLRLQISAKLIPFSFIQIKGVNFAHTYCSVCILCLQYTITYAQSITLASGIELMFRLPSSEHIYFLGWRSGYTIIKVLYIPHHMSPSIWFGILQQ